MKNFYRKAFFALSFSLVCFQGFTQTSVFFSEAEDADEISVEGTRTCANGDDDVVTFIGKTDQPSNFIQWNNVTLSESGNYTLVIPYYSSHASPSLDLVVNGTTLDIGSAFSSTGGFCATITNQELVINLNAGVNVVRLQAKDDGNPTPFVDYLELFTIDESVDVTSISVEGESGVTVVSQGGTLQMLATVLPEDATNPAVGWSVINGTGEATIDESTGLLTGVSPGNVTVIATANDGSGISGSIGIEVTGTTDVATISIAADGEVTTIEEFIELQMGAEVLPANATDPSVTWSVIDGTGLALITTEGKLIGTKAGTVTVRADANDGSGVFDELEMTITETTEDRLVYKVEAEYGVLSNMAEISALGCANASGLAAVSYSAGGFAKSEHQKVFISEAGAYNLNLEYFSANNTNNTEIFISIDDTSFGDPTLLNFDNVGFCSAGPSSNKDFSIYLEAGTHTIFFRNTNVGGTNKPLIDVITLTRVDVTSITVSGTAGNDTVLESETLQMEATVLPENATNAGVVWSVDDEEVATIDSETGILSGVAAGTVNVTATAEDGSGVFGSTQIEVVADVIEVTSITVSSEGDATEVLRGQTLQLYADVLPLDATDVSVTWSITNGDGEASVDEETGLLTAVSAGSITAVATANDGSDVSGSLPLTVTFNGVYFSEEAELGVLTSGASVTAATCENASGSGVTKYSDSQTARSAHSGISVPETGIYQLRLTYFSATDTGFDILLDLSIDDDTFSDPQTLEFDPVGFCFETASSVSTYNIELEAGTHTFYIQNTGLDETTEPLLDLIELTEVPIIDVASIELDTESGENTLAIGGTAQMLAEVLPEDASNPSITWSIDGSDGFATIDPIGLVTGVSDGVAIVRASANDASGVEATFDLIVGSPVVLASEIEIKNVLQSSVEVGQTIQLEAVVSPDYTTDKTVTWSVEQGGSFASVNATSGELTGVSAGEIVVRATANDGSSVFGEITLDVVEELTKPNIIVILVDDAGYADFGFTGSTDVATPNIDQLRSEGTFFSQGYITNSVCAPSRAALLTGRYQNRFGFEENIVTYLPAPGYANQDVGMDPNENTIADHLKPLGYSTAAIGKWHLGEEAQHHPNSRGFDYFYGLLSGSRNYFHTSDLEDSKKLQRNGTIDDLTEGYLTDVLTDDAIAWMEQETDNGNPFFTYLSYTAVHGPYEAKPEDLANYDDCGCSEDRQNYLAMMDNLDQNIGKLTDALKANGTYDNTVFFFINDNGGPSNGTITDNGPHRGGKSNGYEGGIRVPFFMKWKDEVPENATYDDPVISMDIAATSIVAAGGNLPVDKALDGVNLLPVVNDMELTAHETLFFRKLWRYNIVIKGDSKLMIFDNDPTTILDNDTLLYDVSNEYVNLYEGGANKALVEQMVTEFETWEEGLVKPYWIGEFVYSAVCEDTSDNFDNCPFVYNYYNDIIATLVESISVTSEGSATSIEEAETLQMYASVLPEDATDASFSWAVINETGQASIDQNGLLTAESEGTVMVTATANDDSQTEGALQVTILAQDFLVDAIEVYSDNQSDQVLASSTLQMFVEIAPDFALDKTVSWSVEDPSSTGSSINSEGLLTVGSAGTITVIATANDGSEITGQLDLTIVSTATSVTSLAISSEGGVSTIGVGQMLQFSASAMPTDATNQSVDWSVTSVSGQATIDSDGVLTAVNSGDVTVTATARDGSGVTDSFSLTIDDIVFSAEFEEGMLLGAAQIIESCSSASGGMFVRINDGLENAVRFENIVVPEAGDYLFTIDYYVNGQDVNLLIDANGEAVDYVFPEAQWCYEGPAHQFIALIPLEEGQNTVTFSDSPNTFPPTLDKFSISIPEPYRTSFQSNKLRMLQGDSVQVVVSVPKELPKDESFSLTVTGLDEETYILRDVDLIIEAGSSSASTYLVSTGGVGSGTISIVNLSENLSEGTNMTSTISILDEGQKIYVSDAEGDDANDGLSESTPIKSLDAISAISLIPGDSIFFRRGDVFAGQFRVNGSGVDGDPIVVTAYGEGEKPVIDGANGSGGAYRAALYIENNDHIELHGLTVTNDRLTQREGEPDDEGYGIMVHNTGDSTMNYFRFNDLTIQEVFAYNVDPETDFNAIDVAGIFFMTSANDSPEAARNINDVIIENSYITHTGKFGIWFRHGNGGGLDSLTRNSNVIIRNNHFFETGGSGILPARVYNCLIENNVFEYPGSNVDPRMPARGSALWFFASINGIAQHNISLHVRGSNDSYGYHIDYGNENIIYQYNYSEDAEGGFAEVLGDNKNVGFRYNISVNDGFRETARTFWNSGYAGNSTIANEGVHIYNNSVFLGNSQSTDILLEEGEVHIFNNILYADNGSTIGDDVTIMETEELKAVNQNNLYFGDVNSDFTDRDEEAIFGNPLFILPGDFDTDSYQLAENSPALNQSTNELPGLTFPKAGKGIFKNITEDPTSDFFGNPVDFSAMPHLGAFNGTPGQQVELAKVILRLSQSGLLPGESAVIEAVLDKEMESGQFVRLDVSNEIFALYSISSRTIDIASNSLSGEVSITSNSNNNLEEDLTATISIDGISSGLELGDEASVSITLLALTETVLGADPAVALKMYPNPVQEFVTVEVGGQIRNMVVTDQSGKKVNVTQTPDGQFDVSGLADGLYIITVVTEDQRQFVGRLLKR